MAELHKTRNEVLPSTQLGNSPMRARVFSECKMAASTVYKHRVLDVAILHPAQCATSAARFFSDIRKKGEGTPGNIRIFP